MPVFASATIGKRNSGRGQHHAAIEADHEPTLKRGVLRGVEISPRRLPGGDQKKTKKKHTLEYVIDVVTRRQLRGMSAKGTGGVGQELDPRYRH